MEHMSLQQLAMLVVIALIAFGTRRLSRRGMRDDLSGLREELQRHMPVYSAETTAGKEAEFIRDRLPKRFPIVLVVLAVLLFGAAAWWLSR